MFAFCSSVGAVALLSSNSLMTVQGIDVRVVYAVKSFITNVLTMFQA